VGAFCALYFSDYGIAYAVPFLKIVVYQWFVFNFGCHKTSVLQRSSFKNKGWRGKKFRAALPRSFIGWGFLLNRRGVNVEENVIGALQVASSIL
jgi:hypothetical protein